MKVDSPFGDLIMAVLSVNKFSLDRTFSLLERLEQQGITDPRNLSEWQPNEIQSRLVKAGYDRGEYLTNLFAERLAALGRRVISDGIETWEAVLRSKDASRVQILLLSSVKGIGPVVLENFYLLQGIPVNTQYRQKLSKETN